jgi:signal transduction histidine kinase
MGGVVAGIDEWVAISPAPSAFIRCGRRSDVRTPASVSRPIREFTEALRRFGTDPRASPIPEAGPRELRSSIGAFNAIQAQIQNFVDDRTTMLAAISHDLRTPLTKIRLRGGFVEDEEQRARLFRDVDDMQAMVDLALAFFRDDFQGEETTAFDFPEMLRTIVDNDQGSEIACDGAEHVPFRGRPFALKRAFTDLVDNAVKYGRSPELEFRVSPPGALTYRQT